MPDTSPLSVEAALKSPLDYVISYSALGWTLHSVDNPECSLVIGMAAARDIETAIHDAIEQEVAEAHEVD